MNTSPEHSDSPKISVIVPVYKVEKYLSECIESVLAQTFTDFELILVDDGSPDNSGKICDEYAKKDSRIRVFHKENGGVSSARNFGLDNARGEWIIFVDSDDWISSELFEVLLNLQKESNADVSLCSWAIANEKSEIFPRKSCRLQGVEYVKRAEAMYRVQNGLFYEGSPCCRIFSHKKINNYKLRFDEKITVGEDWLFSTQYFATFVKSAVSTDKPLYFYRTRHGSAMRTSVDHQWSVLAAQRKVRRIINASFPYNCRLFLGKNIREGMNFFVLLHGDFIMRRGYMRTFLIKNFRIRFPIMLFSRRFSLKNKMGMALMFISFSLWRFVYSRCH